MVPVSMKGKWAICLILLFWELRVVQEFLGCQVNSEGDQGRPTAYAYQIHPCVGSHACVHT
jgi:hypothetical protein